MKLRRYTALLCLCGGIALLSGFFSVPALGGDFSGLLDNFHKNGLRRASLPKQTIVSEFCATALSPKVINQIQSEYPGKDPRQSVFLTLLCQWHFSSRESHQFMKESSTDQGLLKTTSLKTLLKDQPACSEYLDFENCNVAKMTEDLLKILLNELSIIKQGNLYGVTMNNLTSDKDLEGNIDLFTREKLLIHNIDEQSFCRDKKQSYPETCKIMKKTMRAFQKSFAGLQIIDTKKLLPGNLKKFDEEASKCDENINREDYNHLFCEVVGVTNEGMEPFIRKVYTELLWYQLFTAYYSSHLSYAEEEVNIKDRDEIERIREFQKRLLPTINTTIKQLADLQNTYPIHIGMLAYQEELLRLRNKYLSKIVAPFYSTFYKLQNVQIQK